MTIEDSNLFLLSKTKNARGTRRLVREKALQILIAHYMSDTPVELLFDHIFYRLFNFGDTEKKATKLLTPDEVFELEADIPINWHEDEVEFGQKLLSNCLINKNFVYEEIKGFALNWELDRIAPIDKALILIAVTEFVNFPEIPTKVSINESIDISKKYSTDKSSIFINGMLDSILEKLRSEDKIKKSGRGLIE